MVLPQSANNMLNDLNKRMASRHGRIRRQTSSSNSSSGGLWCFVLVAVMCNIAVVGWIASNMLSNPVATSRLRDVSSVATTIIAQQQQSIVGVPLQPVLLTRNGAAAIQVTTDVRGNLGPGPVMLNNGTDWIKDRWQAASDMHGTAVKGSHWVRLDFESETTTAVRVTSAVLDWEAAYAKDYQLQVLVDNDTDTNNKGIEKWKTIFDGTDPSQVRNLQTITETGQSPGVKTKTPLHIIHQLGPFLNNNATGDDSATRSVRVWIERSAMGWGVSLWQIQLYGHFV